ncbi:LysR family transcriptional regulator [Vibrio nigripulchritudo]|uniref:LysR family transcriptional regulator n=1 Tax=Vibrio nigripulchritudo TaxID=28173 RepID=UPI0019095802|nr:LysR family transcriptional regulator [Vibrio nigripulchritudo]BCL68169.1 LysR family transcriptional regulator [Vibrio nigripulchritudo]BDU29497.1 LysR family transcriptional regulator [Vibrio nigripulchritudo]
MDVKVFRTFLEVARVRHFGRAAENLYITQAAVSARIKQLESYFDTSLFIRDRNSIKLTNSGEKLISYAEIMVNTLQQAKTELSLAEDKSIQLTLAGTPNIWDAYLQNCLSVIADTFSGYAFQAEALARESLNRRLVEKTLDMAFAFDPLKSDELACKKVADLVLLMVSTEQADAHGALNNRYVYVDWGTRFASEHADRHRKLAPPLLRTSTARIALDFILDKGGAAYLPASIVEPFIASGQLFQIKDIEPWYRPIYLSYRKDTSAIEAVQRIEAMVKDIDPLTAFSLQQAGEASV